MLEKEEEPSRRCEKVLLSFGCFLVLAEGGICSQLMCRVHKNQRVWLELSLGFFGRCCDVLRVFSRCSIFDARLTKGTKGGKKVSGVCELAHLTAAFSRNGRQLRDVFC